MTDTYQPESPTDPPVYQHQLPTGETFFAPDPPTEGAQPVPRGPLVAAAQPQQQPQPQAALPPTAAVAPNDNDWVDVGSDEGWEDVPIAPTRLDEKAGAPFSLRLEMARAQNPDEAKLVLEKYAGPGNYGQDRRGNWWVMQDGKPTAIFPSGFLGERQPLQSARDVLRFGPAGPLIGEVTRSPAAQNMAAHIGASATPTAGSMAGAAAGTPFGPLGMAVGAGLGAAGGYGVDQIIKWYRGLYAQKPMEVAGNLGKEASLNAAMTGAIPIAKDVLRRGANVFRDWVGVTPEGARMAENLVSEGARPPVKSVAPNSRLMADKQALRNMVANDPWEAANTDYVQNRFKDALKSSGIADIEVEQMMLQSSRPTIAPSSREGGEMIVGRAQQYAGEIRAQAEANRRFAEQELRNAERTLRDWAQGTGRNMETLGHDTAETFIQGRRNFGNTMGREYRAIDSMNGDERIFDLEPAWQQARRIIDLADPGSVPPYLKQMMARYDETLSARAAIPRLQQQINTVRAQGGDVTELERALMEARTRANGNMTTFSEGHEVRNNLRELVGPEVNLTQAPWMNKLTQVEDAIDNTFRTMESAPGLPGAAATRLRLADDQYRRGIQIFKDLQVRRLVREIKAGTSVDPEKVASIILQEGRTEAGRRIIRALPQELRENVARADMRNIIHEASTRDPNGEMQLEGMRLLDALDARKRATLMGDLYSPAQLTMLRDYARQLAALDGRISLEGLPPNQITQAIANAVHATRQLDQFVTRNPIGAMVGGSPEQVDRAVKVLSRPGNEARTLEAARFFGPNSPEWQQVQKNAVQGLVRASVVTRANGTTTISADALERHLKKYTDAQQEVLFPRGLADDFREITKQSRFLFPPGLGTSDDQGMSIAARNITLNAGPNILNPKTVYYDMKYAHALMHGWLMDHPKFLRFLAGTSRENPSEGRAMIGALFKTFMNSQLMGPGRGRPQEMTSGNAQ